MRTTSLRNPVQQMAIIVGPAAAVLAAWLMSVPADTDDAGVTLANVALVMAVVTVGFAVVDWLAGVTTSVTAALALNYFHTEPYHTLRITDRRDVLSVLLLGALGLAVSAVTAVRVRSGVRAIRSDDAAKAASELAAVLADDRPAPDAWVSAIAAASNDLSMVLARIVTKTPGELPLVGRTFATSDDPTLTLPAAGAALRLQHRHAEGRWLVLTPRPGHAPLTIDRRAVLSFADTVELALEPAPSAAPTMA